jgi:signal transduction histidine kinase
MGWLRSLRARAGRIPPGRLDALIALLYLVEAELEILLLAADAPHTGIAALLQVVIAAGLAMRRRAPALSLALGACAFVAFQPLGAGVNDNLYTAFFAVLLLIFSFGLHERDGRRLALGAAGAMTATIVSTLIDAYPTTVVDLVLGAVVVGGGPVLLGRVLSNRSHLNATLREKAEGLRRARAQRAELAVAEERNRVAGELHDVVAHAMSAMVVQAGGARRLAGKDPERARDAFAAVETTGREALTEIRRLLGVLRREDEEIGLAPQPTLRHLTGLLERTRAAGLPVELSVDGDKRPLPPGIDLTAYRLVQSVLGGALEEAGAGRASVAVRYRPDGVELEVVDDGAGGGDERRLLGVRERVSLYGGQLHAGRRRGGGHAVRARLPVGGAG